MFKHICRQEESFENKYMIKKCIWAIYSKNNFIICRFIYLFFVLNCLSIFSIITHLSMMMTAYSNMPLKFFLMQKRRLNSCAHLPGTISTRNFFP